jgi:hypothetical protein
MIWCNRRRNSYTEQNEQQKMGRRLFLPVQQSDLEGFQDPLPQYVAGDLVVFAW